MKDYKEWEVTIRLENLGYTIELINGLFFQIWKGNIMSAYVRGGQGLWEFLEKVK